MIDRGPVSDDSTELRPPRPRRTRGRDELPCLEIVEGATPGTRFWLTGARAVLGRSERADFTIEGEGISREHAKLAIDAEGLVNLVDLGSKNGTFLNDAPIDAAIVRAGDRIRLGPAVTLRFAWLSRTAEAPAAARTVELSPRELEIAKLVADGRTNAEIAELLEISPHTVTTHLSNVFQREGLASRAELASLVAGGRVRAASRNPRSSR